MNISKEDLLVYFFTAAGFLLVFVPTFDYVYRTGTESSRIKKYEMCVREHSAKPIENLDIADHCANSAGLRRVTHN